VFVRANSMIYIVVVHPLYRRRIAVFDEIGQSPASHLSLDNFVRFKIAPGVLNAVARKGNDVGSVVINTEQFNWRSVGRKLIDDERRDPLA
jgi:hypothetical protein